MLDCVVDFANKDWDKIMLLNKLLYAFDVRGKQLQITSARLPAFELVFSEQGSSTAHLQPFVEIQDTPHIDITEVSTEFQSSSADNAFSSKAVETMVSGGSPLVSVSVSAGMKSESSRGTASTEGGQRKEYHATYNFPRVRLFLGESTLQVSEYCDKALAGLQAEPTLTKLVDFQRRFGTIFAQEVLLGGRLESTKAADPFATASTSTAKEAFKASVGAAVSYGPFAASASGSTETQTGHDQGSNNQRGNSAISFTARGGDTLLCVDPPAWAATVAVWRNWRVIQQDEPVSLQALLGRFKKYAFVPDLFAQILKDGPKLPDPTPAPIEPRFDVNKPWKEDSKIRLWIGSNPVLWPLSVRDGDPNNEAAGPKINLLGDYPLLLFKDDARRTPGRDANTIFVNKTNGELVPQQENRGPSRFSFRKLESSGKWQPLNGSTIRNGDKVALWCHSLGEGGWKSLNDAPSSAVQAIFNKDVRFNVPSQTFTAVNGYAPAVFTVEYV
ncbi:MACPF domain-containing protein [Fusarium sp. LHS14.1]|nr:MACPF domain-containing protein [Fusarium sp. LHS14.1]